ncbi:hypothetical protein PPL_07954 [Heterostelium album PN500]|uniref:Uncharacterized protein n=1 Tax=Heterostelium pallidum (strain ATCC 26659 / Pp 5 / PN500) TaxID=670386 RepID=D3BHF2_HETP5|nr:hypothetical protein PPL_07954 [Heterostelium album PN500]EFA79129.1 hypothetical protein PPL_07954 [Heterostelium album PN500]|eukprot:XP_020431251.1 hypothetical protein PPL_07954 [Heterostelium album PN500]
MSSSGVMEKFAKSKNNGSLIGHALLYSPCARITFKVKYSFFCKL